MSKQTLCLRNFALHKLKQKIKTNVMALMSNVCSRRLMTHNDIGSKVHTTLINDGDVLIYQETLESLRCRDTFLTFMLISFSTVVTDSCSVRCTII